MCQNNRHLNCNSIFGFLEKKKKMEITHKPKGHKGVFYINDDTTQPVEITYSMAGKSIMIINRTQVSSEQAYTAGTRLLLAVAEYVRHMGIKIIPLCAFAKTVFAQHEHLQDVLKYRELIPLQAS